MVNCDYLAVCTQNTQKLKSISNQEQENYIWGWMSQSDLELLCAFGRLQTDDDVADGFSIAAHRILCFTRGQLRYLPFIHLLCFFDAQSLMWTILQSDTHAHFKVRIQSLLYIPLSAKLPHHLDHWTMHFIMGRNVCEPMKCQGIIQCNMIALFHTTHEPENEQHTGAWSSMRRVSEQCLSQGLCCTAVTDKVMTSFRWSMGGANVLMTTSAST